MDRKTSYAYQKNVLNQFSGKLNELVNTLIALSDDYERTINSIYEEDGLMEEIYLDYKQIYFDSTKNKITEIAEKILNEDVPFVEKELDFISSR